MAPKRTISLFMVFCFVFGLVAICFDSADAARFGKRRSFGSKPRYQKKAQPPAKQAAAAQKPDQKKQPGANAAPSPRSRWGGMLGGMLMGGLIGSMLFGGGFGGGAGLLDLLLIGGGLFLLFRFFKARKMAAQGASAGPNLSFDRGPSVSSLDSPGPPPAPEDTAAPSTDSSMPAGFDADDFLQGATMIYTRLQAAWDRRDLAEIKTFTSDEVYAEIESQAAEDATPGKTELLMVEPRILEVQENGNQTIVSVLYDVMMRESEDQVAKQVRELWHFSKVRNDNEDFWRLEGIQQIA